MDVTKTGISGLVGSSGSSTTPAGGLGGLGEYIHVSNTGNGTDTSNTAEATGGAGGTGGAGYNATGTTGGAAGYGGAGGGANAGTNVSGTALTYSAATATGGAGGAAGVPGNAGTANAGAGANGGAGGTATATAVLGNSTGAASAKAKATATGGAGGSGTGAGATGGAGGAASGTTATVSGPNTRAYAYAYQTGGAGGAGLNGASGGTGADSILTNAVSGGATSSGTLFLNQIANGGAGGASDGGTAGAAGTAISSLTFDATLAANPPGLVDTNSYAYGGAGGAGTGTTNGAAGGAATAGIDITGLTGNTVDTRVGAVGGTGGAASGTGRTGGAGGVASNTTASASGAVVTVRANQTGGAGGYGAAGADGGAGAASMLTNDVTGTSSTGHLFLIQNSRGGAGGGSSGGTAGTGGAASAYETFNDSANSGGSNTVTLENTATGGAGGYGHGSSSGGAGGQATGGVTLASGEAVKARANATGGFGGSAAGSGTGGTGGSANATASGTSTSGSATAYASATGGSGGNASAGNGGAGGSVTGAVAAAHGSTAAGVTTTSYGAEYGGRGGTGANAGFSGGAGAGITGGLAALATGYSVTVYVNANGGYGGTGKNRASGGAGGAVILTDAVTGATQGGKLSLTQFANGGDGGVSYGGTTGNGGSASSSLTFDDTKNSVAAKFFKGASYALGGEGGYANGGGTGGAGGSANSAIALTGAHNVIALSTATGGAANSFGASAPGRVEAKAPATATAIAFAAVAGSANSATATATAIGSSGSSASTDATTIGTGDLASVTATAGATGGGTLITTDTAAVGGSPTGSILQTDNSYAFALGQVSSTYVNTELSGNANVAAKLGTTQATILGDGIQGGFATSGATGAQSYSSSIGWTIDSSSLTGDLIVGLVKDKSFGTGFTSLSFIADVGGTVTTDIFPSLAAAQNFFTNDALDLGAVPQSAALHVTLSLDLTTSTAGNGFGTEYLLGTTGTACYCRGTSILTDRGEVAVEALSIGDLLVTQAGAMRPIKWIGRRAYAGRFVAGRRDVLPVRIRAGALSDGVPKRDLFVSPLHAMFLDGVLIPASCLVNDLSITQPEDVDQVAYFHLELETHDVIFAEGAPSETFVDGDNRGMFHNATDYRALYPAAEAVPARYCAPRVEDGDALEAVRLRLAERVGAVRGYLEGAERTAVRGWAWTPADPDAAMILRVLADDVPIGSFVADRYRGDLQQAGIGDGCHGFVWTLPERLSPGRHVIRVQRAADGQDVTGSPWTLESEDGAAMEPEPAASTPDGWLDTATRGRIAGWALDTAAPNAAVALTIFDNDLPIGRVLANRYRADLAQAGIGRGRHAFDWAIPGGLSPLARHVIAVRREADGVDVPGSPLVIEAADSFGPALEQAVSRAVDALAPDAGQARVLSFMLAQAERLLQNRAEAEGGLAERQALRQFRRRWGSDAAAEAPEGAGPRALVIDLAMPDAARDAGSRAILSHMAALQTLGYAVNFVAAEAMEAAASDDLAALGIAACGAPFYASVEDVLRRQAGCFDVVYLHRVQIASRYMALVRQYLPRARVLYSVADLHHVRLARQAAAEDRPELAALGQRMRVAEVMAAWSADAVLTHSAAELALLREAVPQASVHVVPWAVTPRPVAVPFAERRGVAFVGSYGHAPNADAARWLVEAVMPLVWAEDPAIPCLLAGSGTTEEIRALAGPRVVVLGEVADLDQEVFGRARLTVAPLRFGAGVKGKVLDSFAAGLPCVMSEMAAEGLDLPPALRGLVGQDAAGLAALILRYHADEAAHAAAARQGVAFVRAGFGAATVAAALRGAIGARHDGAVALAG